MLVNEFGYFGATNVSGTDCPAEGDWDTWCDCMFTTEPALSKCKSWRPGAPWTVVGAALRGIPSPTSSFIGAAQAMTSGGSAAGSSGGSGGAGGLFTLPRTIAIAGSAVLVGGLALFALSGRKKK